MKREIDTQFIKPITTKRKSLTWRDGLADDPRERERHDTQPQRKHAERGVAQRVVALAEAEG